MMYINTITGETYTLEEIKESYEQYKCDMAEKYDSFEEYFDVMCSRGDFEIAKFYAVLRDKDDNDWGYGSYKQEEAEQMARDMGPEAYIAVIEMGNDPICVEEIEQDDFITEG